jgi:hypothetical protein
VGIQPAGAPTLASLDREAKRVKAAASSIYHVRLGFIQGEPQSTQYVAYHRQRRLAPPVCTSPQVESPGGTAPPGAHRSGLERLDASGSSHSSPPHHIGQWANKPGLARAIRSSQ